jgi:hypothetical protein
MCHAINASYDIDLVVWATTLVAYQVGKLIQIWLHKLHYSCIGGF